MSNDDVRIIGMVATAAASIAAWVGLVNLWGWWFCPAVARGRVYAATWGRCPKRIEVACGGRRVPRWVWHSCTGPWAEQESSALPSPLWDRLPAERTALVTKYYRTERAAMAALGEGLRRRDVA